MLRFTALILLVCAYLPGAQSPDDAEVARAKAESERVRQAVAVGAAARAQLAKAEEAVADAEDSAFLRKTLYGRDLTEAQADEMVAAARRRFERRKKAYDDALRLVQLGAAGQLSVGPARDNLEMARRESDLAQSRADLTREVAQMAAAEEALQARLAEAPSDASTIAERFDGDGVFSTLLFARVERAFAVQFGRPMPVSAMGETAVHRAMGFDHTGRVDVALHPDTAEGAWLLQYLTAQRIPFYAFRQAMPGKATGAHIHIGPGSTRLANGG